MASPHEPLCSFVWLLMELIPAFYWTSKSINLSKTLHHIIDVGKRTLTVPFNIVNLPFPLVFFHLALPCPPFLSFPNSFPLLSSLSTLFKVTSQTFLFRSSLPFVHKTLKGFVSFFSCCWGRTPWWGQLKEEYIYFGSHSEVGLNQSRKIKAVKAWRSWLYCTHSQEANSCEC